MFQPYHSPHFHRLVYIRPQIPSQAMWSLHFHISLEKRSLFPQHTHLSPFVPSCRGQKASFLHSVCPYFRFSWLHFFFGYLQWQSQTRFLLIKLLFQANTFRRLLSSLFNLDLLLLLNGLQSRITLDRQAIFH